MTKRSIRFTEEEETLLQEQAEASGVTVSELIRGRLFSGNPFAFSPVSVADGAKTGKISVESGGKTAGPDASSAPIYSPEAERRLEKLEREMELLSRELGSLKDLFLEQRSRPFGLDLPFVQATLMAAFALARGSFSYCPAEWEAFKDEAWRRAFAREEGEKCPPKS